jgi:hypothetical protein
MVVVFSRGEVLDSPGVLNQIYMSVALPFFAKKIIFPFSLVVLPQDGSVEMRV